MMINPFTLMWRLLVASFRIIGYVLVFLVQVFVYRSRRSPQYKIGDAIGQLGTSIVDALGDVFRD